MISSFYEVYLQLKKQSEDAEETERMLRKESDEVHMQMARIANYPKPRWRFGLHCPNCGNRLTRKHQYEMVWDYGGYRQTLLVCPNPVCGYKYAKQKLI